MSPTAFSRRSHAVTGCSSLTCGLQVSAGCISGDVTSSVLGVPKRGERGLSGSRRHLVRLGPIGPRCGEPGGSRRSVAWHGGSPDAFDGVSVDSSCDEVCCRLSRVPIPGSDGPRGCPWLRARHQALRTSRSRASLHREPTRASSTHGETWGMSACACRSGVLPVSWPMGSGPRLDGAVRRSKERQRHERARPAHPASRARWVRAIGAA